MREHGTVRDFKETVAARVQNDPAFAQALLDEAVTLFVNGEPDSAKLIQHLFTLWLRIAIRRLHLYANCVQ